MYRQSICIYTHDRPVNVNYDADGIMKKKGGVE